MENIVKSAGVMRIYCGRATGPLTARGGNQINMLDFAFRHRQWHTYGRDKATMRALQGLERRGSIVVDRQYHMFKINMGGEG